MRSQTSVVPVVALSAPPRGSDETSRFAGGLRTLADTLRASAVVVVESHWNRANDEPAIIIDVSHSSAEVQAAFVLAEQISEILKEAGMKPQHGGAWPRDTRVWKAISDASASAPRPILHVSVPARFGPALIRMAALAIRPLREQRVLFVGFSDAFGDAMLAADAREADVYNESTEGAPI
jgi:aromatic ring-opening dioxygenase catalytic subunit (LigB family)